MGHHRGIPVFFNDLMWSVSIDAGRIGVQSVGNRYPNKTSAAAGVPSPMPKSPASSTLNISGLLPYYALSPGLLVPHDRVFQRADTFVSADRPVAFLQVDRGLASRAHT